jgi:hypothetical protein
VRIRQRSCWKISTNFKTLQDVKKLQEYWAEQMKTNSYGIVKAVERKNSQFPVGARTFSLLHNVQTSSRAHTATYIMGTRHCFTRVKWPGREADHSPLSSAEVDNGGTIPPLPIHYHRVVLN